MHFNFSQSRSHEAPRATKSRPLLRVARVRCAFLLLLLLLLSLSLSLSFFRPLRRSTDRFPLPLANSRKRRARVPEASPERDSDLEGGGWWPPLRVGVARAHRRRWGTGEGCQREEEWSSVTNNRPEAEIAAPYLAMNYHRRGP